MKIPPLTKFTLLLLSMSTMMSNVAIITALPHLKDHFPNQEHIEFLSRLVITLPSLSIALLSPFLGHLLQNFTRRGATLVALFLFSLFGTAGFYLQSIESILASRLLFGVAIAALMIVTTSLVGDYFTNETRPKYMGLQSAFGSFGGLLFLVGGGLLSDIGWRYPFLIYLIGVVFMPMVWLFLKEPVHAFMAQDDEMQPRLFGIYVLAFVLMLIFYILPTQVPFLIMNHFHASGSFTGFIIATAFMANALGALTFSKLKKHFDFAIIYLIGTAIVGIGFIAIGAINNVYLFFMTSPIMGFGGGILMTNIVAWMLSKSHQKRRVKSSGYLSSALFLGQAASPVVFHPFVRYFGVQHFFSVLGVMLLSIIMVFFVINRLKKQPF